MTSFFKPSALCFAGIFLLLNLLYKYNDLYPRLYQKPIEPRTEGVCSGYWCRERRVFAQFLYWIDFILLCIFLYLNYDACECEFDVMVYAMATVHFILETLFIFRMRMYVSTPRDFRISKSVKIFSVAFVILMTIFYFYTSRDGEYSSFFDFVIVVYVFRSFVYDGFLFALGGYSTDHQMATSTINQTKLTSYADTFNDDTATETVYSRA